MVSILLFATTEKNENCPDEERTKRECLILPGWSSYIMKMFRQMNEVNESNWKEKEKCWQFRLVNWCNFDASAWNVSSQRHHINYCLEAEKKCRAVLTMTRIDCVLNVWHIQWQTLSTLFQWYVYVFSFTTTKCKLSLNW